MSPTRRIVIPSAVACALAFLATQAHAQAADPASAGDAARAICAGKLASTALVGEAIARAKARAELNAFITLDEQGALAAARRADATKGKACKPLTGMPIVVKDNIQVAGLPTTGGTPALKDFVPKVDAPVVKRLRDAGAIVLGKTQLHELAFGISGYNPAYNNGAQIGVRNAYDSTRSSGGSSAGTGAALGARIVLAGLGTDTGGSVRIPCAFNGCASLRPTVGRYPQQGIVPISHTRDTAGPMALAMADVELLDRVISGAPRAAAADLKHVRLGLVKAMLANLDADTQAAFDAAVAAMKAAGVTIVDVEMPRLTELNNAISFPVALYEAYDDVIKYLHSTGTGLTIAKMAESIASPDVKGTFQGLVIPRKLPGAEQHAGRRQARLRGGDENLAPCAAEALRRHLPPAPARRAGLPDDAQGGDAGQPGVQQRGDLRRRDPEHRPGQQCGRSWPADSDRARGQQRPAGGHGTGRAGRRRPAPGGDRPEPGSAAGPPAAARQVAAAQAASSSSPSRSASRASPARRCTPVLSKMRCR